MVSCDEYDVVRRSDKVAQDGGRRANAVGDTTACDFVALN